MGRGGERSRDARGLAEGVGVRPRPALGLRGQARSRTVGGAEAGRGVVRTGQLRTVRLVREATSRRSVEANRRRFDRWAPRYGEDRRSRWMGGLQEQAVAALELRS